MAERNFREDNKSFMVYKDWENMLEVLDSSEQIGELFRALFAYAKRGEKPQFDGALKMAFIMMSQQIDRDGKKWEEACENKQRGASKRWGKKTSTVQTLSKKVSHGKPADKDKVIAKDTVTDTDTVTVTVTEKEKDTAAVKAGEKETVTETAAQSAIPPAAVGRADARFTPPSLEEVRKFCYSEKYLIDAQRFYNYYTSNGWKVGRNPMKDWKAAVRTWVQREHPQSADGSFAQTAERSYDLDKLNDRAGDIDYSTLKLWD